LTELSELKLNGKTRERALRKTGGNSSKIPLPSMETLLKVGLMMMNEV
jgi:hypothetical protein